MAVSGLDEHQTPFVVQHARDLLQRLSRPGRVMQRVEAERPIERPAAERQRLEITRRKRDVPPPAARLPDLQHLERDVNRNHTEVQPREPLRRPSRPDAEIQNQVARGRIERVERDREVVHEPHAFGERVGRRRGERLDLLPRERAAPAEIIFLGLLRVAAHRHLESSGPRSCVVRIDGF
jgi:hypothetical protein